MNNTRKVRVSGAGSVKFVVAGVIIAVCVVALMVVMSYMSLDFYSSTSEFLENIDTYEGGAVRVRGIVEAGSVKHNTDNLDIEFTLVDNEASLRVFYHGILPVNFVPGSDLVVQGAYDGERKLLVANQLMFKCPSKYESKKGTY